MEIHWCALKDGFRIELRYPGGEEGELWVGELMDWLISLGIPSKYLVAVPGSDRMHPAQESLAEMMRAAGFDECEWFNLVLGVVAVHRGRRL